MADDEAAELRAALANAKLPVPVPDDWPALPEPEDDEPLRGYVIRAILSHPVPAALGSLAVEGGCRRLSVDAVRPAQWTREAIQAPGDPPPESRWKGLASTSGGGFAVRNRAPGATIAGQRAELLGYRVLCRLTVGMLDALRSGGWELWGMQVGSTAPEPVPRKWLGVRGLVLAVSQEQLRPAKERGASGLPHYSGLTLRSRQPARAALSVAPPPPPAMAEAEAPDPLLLRYGLPLARALLHLTDRALLLHALRPVDPAERDALVARWDTQSAAESPWPAFTGWDRQSDRDALAEEARRQRLSAEDALKREANEHLIRDLGVRLAAGSLVAWGRLGSIAEDYQRIPPDAWPHLRVVAWDSGHVEGGKAVFYGVRVADPKGLPMQVAAAALAPVEQAREAYELEAAGYPWPLPLMLYGQPRAASFSAEDHRRASDLWGGFQARLLRLLAAGTLTATGWDVAGRPHEGGTTIFAPRWRRFDDDGLYVLWPESIVRFSPDARPFTDFDTDRLIQIRDVRVHFAEARPAMPSQPVAPVQVQPCGPELEPFDLPWLRSHYMLRNHARKRAGRALASEIADYEWARGIMEGVTRNTIRELRKGILGAEATKRGPRGPRGPRN